MKHLLWLVLLASTLSAEPKLQVLELNSQEEKRYSSSLFKLVHPGPHECLMAHVYRLVRVNGAVHGLALHQTSLMNNAFAWNHYVWRNGRWVRRGPGIPFGSDDEMRVVGVDAEQIKALQSLLVRGLALEAWPPAARARLFEVGKFKDF